MISLPTPKTRLQAAEMALRALEIEREALPWNGRDPVIFGSGMAEAEAHRRAVVAYIEDVTCGVRQLGEKRAEQYALDACVLINAAFAMGNPPADILAHAHAAANLAVMEMERTRP